MTHIRFLGIQMNCTQNSMTNAQYISDQLDLYPSADYAVTPECALTGYWPGWDTDRHKALDLVCAAARRNSTSVFLGTIWQWNGPYAENTCLVINSTGDVVTHQSKHLTIGLDHSLELAPAQSLEPVSLPEHPHIRAGVMICNDFWGAPHMNAPTLPTVYRHTHRVNCFIHLTNGDRGISPTHDRVYWDWHVAWLQMMSRYHMIPTISVDNCSSISGDRLDGTTASPSGVWFLGTQQIGVPHTGAHSFLYAQDRQFLELDPESNPMVNALQE